MHSVGVLSTDYFTGLRPVENVEVPLREYGEWLGFPDLSGLGFDRNHGIA